MRVDEGCGFGHLCSRTEHNASTSDSNTSCGVLELRLGVIGVTRVFNSAEGLVDTS